MKLLKVTETRYPKLEGLFEDVKHVQVEQLAPEVRDGRGSLRLNGRTAGEFDAAFLQIPEEKPVFGRIVAEMMEEHGLNLNYSGMGFFVMAKKNYLSYVLHEKGISAPKTVSLASRKAVRNVENHLEFPVVASRYDEMRLMESTIIRQQPELEEFVEGLEYGEDLVLLREFREGDKYRVFYCDGDLVSLEDRTEGWELSTENLHYSSLSSDEREQVKAAMQKVGARFGEVLLRAGEVVDISPNPDLEIYTSVSGKNAFESTADLLKEGS